MVSRSRPVRSLRVLPNLDREWDDLFREAHARLEKRVKELEAPEFNWAPAQDLCNVYRLPEREVTKGGIVIPEQSRMPMSFGLLLSAGLEAMDIIHSHGIFVGDIVSFSKYAGEEASASLLEEATQALIQRAQGFGLDDERGLKYAEEGTKDLRNKLFGEKKVLELKVSFLHQSTDTKARLCGDEPTMEVVRLTHKGGEVEHIMIPRQKYGQTATAA